MSILLAISGAQIVDILAVGAFVAAGIYAWRKSLGSFPSKLRQLEEKGYVIESREQRQNKRKVSLIWGQLPQPVNLRFQVVEAKLVDQSKKFADSDGIETGDAEFDERFAVLMDLPHLATAVLDHPIRESLSGLDEANFATGSIASLLDVEDFPEVQGADRGVLGLWAMHLDREKITNAEADTCVKVGRQLAERVSQVAATNGLTPS